MVIGVYQTKLLAMLCGPAMFSYSAFRATRKTSSATAAAGTDADSARLIRRVVATHCYINQLNSG